MHKPDTLYLRCAECGGEVIIPDADLLAEVEQQAAEYTPPPAEGGYTPSEETIRLAGHSAADKGKSLCAGDKIYHHHCGERGDSDL